jgi:hypothetical protein
VFTYGPANGTEENGIGVLCGVKSFVGQGRSGSIDRCTTEQLILEVEGSVVTALLDDAEDLACDGFY